MRVVVKSAVAAVALALSTMSGAQAAMLNLTGYIGNANVFSFTDFGAPSADVEGAILAGGNVTLSSYSTNLKNVDAYGQYSLIAGGSLTYTGGNIFNGDVYVGGTVTYNSGGAENPLDAGYTTYTSSTGTAPVDTSKLAAGLTRTSAELAAITPTAASTQDGTGIYITGTKSAVEVITIQAEWMGKSTWYDLSNMAKDATLIVNVIGDSATITGGYQAFDNYNVLFNFVNATDLNIATGANISILAPTAVVEGGSGVIEGTVVVKSWDSSVQINTGNAFVATDVAGLVTAIPEPETYAMLLSGLGLMGLVGRRRRKATAAR